MTLIVMKMATGPNSWVQGECDLLGYRGLISVNQINFGIDVKSVFSEEGRRTVHLPSLSRFTLERRVDLATADITKFALTARVATAPWSIYFLRALGTNLGLSLSHIRDLELTLHRALITDQAISFSDSEMTETLEISAAAVGWTYYTYGEADEPLGQVAYQFDMQEGSVI